MHPHHLGTPRVVVDAAGVTVWRWDNLEPFGLTGVQTDPDGNGQTFVFNLRFAGQYFDAESGLLHNRHRDYDSASGRYVQADPIGLSGGISLYSYVSANPLSFIDPLGLAGNPANATHVQYEGIKNGKPYVGYASKPGLGHSGEDVLKYRYPNTSGFDVAPKVNYVGDGQKGKDVARGLEQRTFEERGGLGGTDNKQNPVGGRNPHRDRYLDAADNHRKKKC